MELWHPHIYNWIFSLLFPHNHFPHKYRTWTPTASTSNSTVSIYTQVITCLIHDCLSHGSNTAAAKGSWFMSGLTHNIYAQFLTAVLWFIGVTLEIDCNAYRQLFLSTMERIWTSSTWNFQVNGERIFRLSTSLYHHIYWGSYESYHADYSSGMCCLHLQWKTLKMEAVCSSKTSVTIY